MDNQSGHTQSQNPHSHSVFATLNRKKDLNNPALAKAQESRENAAREAKRYLLQVVRNDWSYDSIPRTAPASATTETNVDAALGSENPRNVREWRIRDQDSSGSEVECASGKGDDPDPYRFESPDAIESTMLERRRKRRKLIEEEAEWNAGLRVWVQRRDAWTGAKVASSLPSVNPDPELCRESTSSDETGDGSNNGSCGTDATDAGSQCSSQPASCTSAQKTTAPTTLTSNAAPIVPKNLGTSDEPLIPILDPILPDENPLRASITPAVYPAIYSRLVVQSHAPAVPINLAHMTRALVQGWKADGEWPPKPTVARDVPVVKKYMKNKTTVNGGNNNAKGTKKSGVTGVSNAVKKVLGLSSFSPGHRMHVRANSANASITRITEDGAENI